MLCLVLVSAAVLTVPISGMIGVVGKATAAPEESVLRVGFMQLIDKLNPYTGLSDAAYIFYGLVYDALQSVGNDLEVVGNLATDAYPVPANDPELIASGEPYGSVWEYKISQNTVWHDGEPFTTEDVVWNLELSCDELNYENMWAYQPYAYFMNYAEVIDEETVRVHFYDRDSGEPKTAAYANLLCIPMLPKHLLEDIPPANIGFNWPGVFNSSVSDYPIVGTGQFMGTPEIYDEFLNENYLTLVKNPNYHGLADWGVEVKFDKLIIKY
jgi:ABC-type transport system substrate-binding protein